MDDVLRKMVDAAGIETASSNGHIVETPTFDTDALGRFVFTWKGDGIRILVESLEKRPREFNAVISVHQRPPGTETTKVLLAKKRINFLSTNACTSLRRDLQSRIDRDWAQRLATVQELCDENYQSGDPMVWLDEVPEPDGTKWLIEPIIELDQHTTIFAEGDSTKSLFSLALAISAADSVPVLPSLQFGTGATALLLDWEASQDTHKSRYTKILKGINSTGISRKVGYKRMTSPLAEVVDEVSELIQRNNITFVIIDSVGLACGGQISDEPAVLAFFGAARKLGVTVLSIAHVRKDGAENKPNGKPIGSQYWHSQPRATWEVVKTQEPGDDELTIAIHHRKHNNTQAFATLGFRVQFGDDFIRYSWADPSSKSDLEKTMPLTQRIQNVLVDEPNLTAPEIAERLEVSHRNVNNRLMDNMGKRFIRLGDGRPFRWGVITRMDEPDDTWTRQTRGLNETSTEDDDRW